MKTKLFAWAAGVLVIGCAATTPGADEPSHADPPADPQAAETAADSEPAPAFPEPAAEPAPVVEPAPEALPSPTPGPTPVVAPDPGAVAGANLTVGSLSADGMTLTDVSCRADGLGFLGSVIIAGTLAKKKSALSACAKGQSPRVHWTFENDRITSVSVENADAKAAACLGKALQGAASPGEGECAATLVL